MAGSLRTQLFALLLLTGGGVALACGGDGGDDGGTPPNTTAIAKASSSGDAQTGTVGQELTALLQVVVTDGGAPSAGKTVTWATASGGSLDPTSAVTDASGIASTTWTLGTTAGAQTATATLSGASGSPVTFNATADPDAPAALSKAGGDQQNASLNGPLPLPVQAKVADQFGNGVPDVAVGWTATSGTVSAPSVPSDAVGISSVTVTAGGTAGPITIVATAENLTGSPQTFTATASETPPTPTTAAVSVANNSFTPASLTIAAGTTVVWTWQASAMSHTVTPVASEPSGSGPPADAPKTYQYKFSNPGTFVYYCTVHGSPTAGMRGTIIVQ
jgi:plastocyanin